MPPAVLAEWPFVTPIPGSRKSERIKENVDAATIELTVDELAQIEKELSRIMIHGNRTDEDIAKLRTRRAIATSSVIPAR